MKTHRAIKYLESRMISNLGLLAGVILICFLSAGVSRGQGSGQTPVGYIDPYGNGILTVSENTLDTAFYDELNSESDPSLYSANFENISILLFSDDKYHLVAQGANVNFVSIVVDVILAHDGSGNLFIADDMAGRCSCPLDVCAPDCGGGGALCPCPKDEGTLHNPNHLGNFY